MGCVPSRSSSIKRPSRARRRRSGRVVIHDFDHFLFVRKHVDIAERGLERARGARTAVDRDDALATVRMFVRTTQQMFDTWRISRAMWSRYVEQESRLAAIGRAADDIERDARRSDRVVVDLAEARARRAGKAVAL